MSKTIQSKGELYLTENQFNNRDSSGTLEEGVVYNIIDPVGYATEEYVNEQISSNGGTKVTVGGSNVATFNADTKLDKLSPVNQGDKVYAITNSGEQKLEGYSGQLYAYTLAYRVSDGRLLVGTPTGDNDATTKKYVDDIADTKVNTSLVAVPATANTVAKRHADGKLYVGTPTENYDAATKKYVDDKVSSNTFYNENILINGEFNVNQEGTTEYTIGSSKKKTVDMWIGWNGAGTFNANTRVLTNTLGSSSTTTVMLQQAIEYYGYLWGKTLTLSAKIDGTIYSVTGTLPSSAPTAKTFYLTKNITTSSGYSVFIRLRYETSTKMLYADIGLAPNSTSLTAVSSITLGFVKLEYGSTFTPIRRGGWNTWSGELVKCQRYYQLAYLHGVSYFAANATTIFPCIRLQSMRTTPTLSVKQLPTIIGEGASHSSTAMVHNSYWSNIEQVKITTSGLTANKIYVMRTGAALLDANIY